MKNLIAISPSNLDAIFDSYRHHTKREQNLKNLIKLNKSLISTQGKGLQTKYEGVYNIPLSQSSTYILSSDPPLFLKKFFGKFRKKKTPIRNNITNLKISTPVLNTPTPYDLYSQTFTFIKSEKKNEKVFDEELYQRLMYFDNLIHTISRENLFRCANYIISSKRNQITHPKFIIHNVFLKMIFDKVVKLLDSETKDSQGITAQRVYELLEEELTGLKTKIKESKEIVQKSITQNNDEGLSKISEEELEKNNFAITQHNDEPQNKSKIFSNTNTIYDCKTGLTSQKTNFNTKYLTKKKFGNESEKDLENLGKTLEDGKITQMISEEFKKCISRPTQTVIKETEDDHMITGNSEKKNKVTISTDSDMEKYEIIEDTKAGPSLINDKESVINFVKDIDNKITNDYISQAVKMERKRNAKKFIEAPRNQSENSSMIKIAKKDEIPQLFQGKKEDNSLTKSSTITTKKLQEKNEKKPNLKNSILNHNLLFDKTPNELEKDILSARLKAGNRNVLSTKNDTTTKAVTSNETISRKEEEENDKKDNQSSTLNLINQKKKSFNKNPLGEIKPPPINKKIPSRSSSKRTTFKRETFKRETFKRETSKRETLKRETLKKKSTKIEFKLDPIKDTTKSESLKRRTTRRETTRKQTVKFQSKTARASQEKHVELKNEDSFSSGSTMKEEFKKQLIGEKPKSIFEKGTSQRTIIKIPKIDIKAIKEKHEKEEKVKEAHESSQRKQRQSISNKLISLPSSGRGKKNSTFAIFSVEPEPETGTQSVRREGEKDSQKQNENKKPEGSKAANESDGSFNSEEEDSYEQLGVLLPRGRMFSQKHLRTKSLPNIFHVKTHFPVPEEVYLATQGLPSSDEEVANSSSDDSREREKFKRKLYKINTKKLCIKRVIKEEKTKIENFKKKKYRLTNEIIDFAIENKIGLNYLTGKVHTTKITADEIDKHFNAEEPIVKRWMRLNGNKKKRSTKYTYEYEETPQGEGKAPVKKVPQEFIDWVQSELKKFYNKTEKEEIIARGRGIPRKKKTLRPITKDAPRKKIKALGPLKINRFRLADYSSKTSRQASKNPTKVEVEGEEEEVKEKTLEEKLEAFFAKVKRLKEIPASEFAKTMDLVTEESFSMREYEKRKEKEYRLNRFTKNLTTYRLNNEKKAKFQFLSPCNFTSREYEEKELNL